MKLPRFARLLPTVVMVGAGLLVVKTTDLVHGAYAQAEEKVASLTSDPKPANPDYAGAGGDELASASEVDVTNSLAKRRRELEAQAAQLTMQANLIAAAEARVDSKITQLKALQDKIASLLGQRDDAQKAQIAALVKTYSTLGKKAGPIFAGLPDDVAVPVAQAMKSEDLATIMGAMPPDAAQKLSVKLANRLALPQTTDALAPVMAPVAAPVAAATPAATPAPEIAAPVPEKKRAPEKKTAALAPPAAKSVADKPAGEKPADPVKPAPTAAEPEKSEKPKT